MKPLLLGPRLLTRRGSAKTLTRSGGPGPLHEALNPLLYYHP